MQITFGAKKKDVQDSEKCLEIQKPSATKFMETSVFTHFDFLQMPQLSKIDCLVTYINSQTFI